jgi:hypothetical protein
MAFRFGAKDLARAEDRRRLEGIAVFRVSCGAGEVSEAEAAEFRRELEKAREEWEALKKEMRENAAKKEGK